MAVIPKNYSEVDPLLQQYVRESVLPEYDAYDKAHSCTHILSVITQSMELYGQLSAKGECGPDGCPLNPDMIYAIAAYHDIGVCEGREFHHLVSGRMLESDPTLRQWFSEEQIHLMREAVEDHRSSNKSWPRSIYGRIVSEADKVIDFDTVFSRAILYARAHYPGLTEDEIFQKSYGHLLDKYGDNGYMRLQFPDSPNARRLAELREKLRDPELMRREFSLFQIHPLEPFVPEGAKVLLLGSFPPPHARWSMEFFYPNFQNDMWRIMGLLFYGDPGHFVVPGQRRFDYERVTAFCRREGIAMYDAAYMVKRLRGNASDLPCGRVHRRQVGRADCLHPRRDRTPGRRFCLLLPLHARSIVPRHDIFPYAIFLPCLSAAFGEESGSVCRGIRHLTLPAGAGFLVRRLQIKVHHEVNSLTGNVSTYYRV